MKCSFIGTPLSARHSSRDSGNTVSQGPSIGTIILVSDRWKLSLRLPQLVTAEAAPRPSSVWPQRACSPYVTQQRLHFQGARPRQAAWCA